ncbi:replicative DNA helicase [Streptomyces sp. ME19-01-6]|uniref:replicative DNA helicase n=1 Tax=Streptomyces sp. ME19-01-6 TaxID=3028686 RepID=UPI0029BC0825|nr:replicative DNA helicase [Streptomyces sp. ME19-01-6]MDX3232858.1 replicative DNA helicase [Streptomyces sp. ME19-01-6]
MTIPEQNTTVPANAPHDTAAEKAVLAAMLHSRGAIAEVIETPLRGHHFYVPAHELVWNAILYLNGKGEPADPITVTAHLTVQGNLARAGGAGAVHDLAEGLHSVGSADYHAYIVHEHHERRALIRSTLEAANRAMSGQGTVHEIASEVQLALSATAESGTERRPSFDEALAVFHDEYDERAKNEGRLTGLATGFSDLDSLTQGFQPGQMIVVAGRPAMGKSTLGIDFVRACALKHRLPAVFFSLEMGQQELVRRILSAEARAPLHGINSASLPEPVMEKVNRVTAELMGAPLTLDDSPDLDLVTIRAKARKLKEKQDLSLIVVDYLQLMHQGGRRAPSRQEEVSEISRSLKRLAKELEVPVVALSQLNRGPEQRTDKKPMVSDLRESGSIEQDADMVILLHREDAYEKESPRAGEADLIVAKHRNGPTATITVAFQGHYSRFVDMAQT